MVKSGCPLIRDPSMDSTSTQRQDSMSLQSSKPGPVPLWRMLVASGITLLVLLSVLPVRGGTAASPSFKNPVYAKDFPDPFVLKVGKTYYAYSTNVGAVNVPTLRSPDLVHWTPRGDAMPATARWVVSDIWAPDIIQRGDGVYVLYYTGHDFSSGRQCIGHAISKSPLGPFKDSSNTPFVCQVTQGGDIDADAYKDSNGNLYLVYKNDGNCCSMTTHLYAQRMSRDGMKLLGRRVSLTTNNDRWEGSVVEGPEMRRHAGAWFLFFSANDYASTAYAVGYSVCKGPLGPCTSAKENPILSTHRTCLAAGPGGETLITDAAGQWWILYHAWRKNSVGYQSGGPGRQMWMDRLDWKNGKPVVHGPTCSVQRAPTI